MIKRKPFNWIVTIVRKYIRLFVPLLFASLGMLYVLPFLSDGPIYYTGYRAIFGIPCEGGWYFNLFLIQNWLYFKMDYNKETCYPFISDSAFSGSGIPQESGAYSQISGSACKS